MIINHVAHQFSPIRERSFSSLPALRKALFRFSNETEIQDELPPLLSFFRLPSGVHGVDVPLLLYFGDLVLSSDENSPQLALTESDNNGWSSPDIYDQYSRNFIPMCALLFFYNNNI